MQPGSRKLSDKLRFLHSRFDYFLYRLKHKPKPVNPDKIYKILCIELLFLGDLIVTTPAIRALKETFPKAEITFILPKGMKPVLDKNPNVKHIIELDLKTFNKRSVKQLLRSLRSMQFDMGIIFYPGNKLISKLVKKSRIPIRVGCAKTGFLEGKGKYLTHKVKPSKEKKNYVEENLDVVKTVGANTDDLRLELDASADLKNFFNRNNINSDNFLIVVHPGPRHKTHKWLNLRFSAVIDALIEKYNAKVILTGVKRDQKDIEEIVATVKNRNNVSIAVGKSLNEFFTIIKRSDLVISVDTGAMHVGAAFQKPVVALFGAGDPRIWKPWCDKCRVVFKPQVCTSCMKHICSLKGSQEMICMKSISVEDVLKACDDLISDKTQT